MGEPTIFAAGHAFSTTGTSVTIPKWEGLEEGDILYLAHRAQDATITAVNIPEGFSRQGVPFMASNSNTRAHGFYVKEIGDPDAEPESYTISVSGPSLTRQVLVAFVVRDGYGESGNELLGFANSYQGTGSGTTGTPKSAPLYELSKPNGLQLFQGGAEITSGNSHVPTVTPSSFTKIDDVATGADNVNSRTYIWVGYKRVTESPALATGIGWGSSSGSHAESITVSGKATEVIPPDPDPIGLPALDGAGQSVFVSMIDDEGNRVAPKSLIVLKRGFETVDEMLSTPGATWAHRGGSLNFPEMSEFAYDEAALIGYGALEFSAQRTSDGWWFGLHDNSLARTSPGSGDATPSTYTRAQIESLQNQVNANGRPRPYWGLIEFLDKWTPTHVVIVDCKNAINFNSEFLDILDAHGGPEKIIWKWFGVGNSPKNAALAAAARGYETWGYFYADQASPANGGTGDLQTFQSAYSILGMSITASTAIWNELNAIGKPTVGHIASSQAMYLQAMDKGADMVQCSNILAIPAVSV